MKKIFYPLGIIICACIFFQIGAIWTAKKFRPMVIYKPAQINTIVFPEELGLELYHYDETWLHVWLDHDTLSSEFMVEPNKYPK
jgi:hypothetical protein